MDRARPLAGRCAWRSHTGPRTVTGSVCSTGRGPRPGADGKAVSRSWPGRELSPTQGTVETAGAAVGGEGLDAPVTLEHAAHSASGVCSGVSGARF